MLYKEKHNLYIMDHHPPYPQMEPLAGQLVQISTSQPVGKTMYSFIQKILIVCMLSSITWVDASIVTIHASNHGEYDIRFSIRNIEIGKKDYKTLQDRKIITIYSDKTNDHPENGTFQAKLDLHGPKLTDVAITYHHLQYKIDDQWIHAHPTQDTVLNVPIQTQTDGSHVMGLDIYLDKGQISILPE